MKLPNMNRTMIICMLFVAAAAGAFAEGARERKAPEGRPVTVRVAALKGPSGFGMVRLFSEKPELGPQVSAEYELAASPDLMVAKIVSGAVDFAALPVNVAAKLYGSGIDYPMGAVTGYGVLYLMSRDPSIDSWADLSGRTVHNIGQGATPDFLFRYLLSRNGIVPEQDVRIDFSLGHPELAQSLIAGRVDTGILPEPFVTKVLNASKDVRVALDLQKEWSRIRGTDRSYPITVLVVRGTLARERPDIVKAFLDAYRDSVHWANEQPGEAGRLIDALDFGMNAQEAAAALPRCNLTFIPAGEAKDLVRDFLQVLLDYAPQALGGKLPDEGFYLSE